LANNPSFLALVPKDPSHPAGVVFGETPIPGVLYSGRKPQIRPPIVERITVDVIYLCVRPFARHPKPDNAVRPVDLVVDRKDTAAISVSSPLDRSGDRAPSPAFSRSPD
jgi:hypothetical protein